MKVAMMMHGNGPVFVLLTSLLVLITLAVTILAPLIGAASIAALVLLGGVAGLTSAYDSGRQSHPAPARAPPLN